MPKNRLEAFSDSVIAFVITLLALEIRAPQLPGEAGTRAMLDALAGLLPNFLVYVVSFLVCAVWWMAHHGFVHDLVRVNRPLLWLNNLFLLWLVVLPFPTALLGQHPGEPVAAAVYGILCACAGVSFWLMRRYASLHRGLMREEIGAEERVRRLRRSMLSPFLYSGGALLSLISPVLGFCIYAAVPAYYAIANLAGSRAAEAES